MPKDRGDAMLAMSRSLSMPEAPFEDLITELGGADDEEEHPLSAGLATLDMQLPSMDLTHDMQGELPPLGMSPSAVYISKLLPWFWPVVAQGIDEAPHQARPLHAFT